VLRLLALTLVLLALSPEVVHGRVAGWRMPLEGPVTGGFEIKPEAPFAAGQRRGVDIAAPPGTTVRSACTGSVSFAGRVPGGDGALGVSVRCGGLTATHLGLASLRVARGRAVGAGHRLGVVGRWGVLRLGARVTTRRFGYLDPLGLIGGGSAPPPLPFGRAPRGRRAVRPRTPAPFRVRARVPSPAPRPAGVPLGAWLGVGLLAAGTGCGALVRRTRSRGLAVARGVVREGA